MRYLRMLSNSVIGGTAFALYLTVLVLQLNPRYAWAAIPALVATLILSYGMHASAAFYALIVFRQLVATEVISPGWISFRVLVWLCSIASSAGAVLMWVNLRGFAPMLGPGTVPRMTAGALALSVCASSMIALAVAHRWAARHSSRFGAALLALALMASVAVPLTLRGPGVGPAKPARWPQAMTDRESSGPEGRIILLLFEGASLDTIAPAAAEGRLPHFDRLLDMGASMHTATIRPTQPGPVWAAASTGRLPVGNGIRSAALYWPLGSQDALEVLPDFCFAHALVRFGFLRQQMHTSGDLLARPLWSILGSQGVPVGIVNWSNTHPVDPVHGYVVGDQFERLRAASVDLENTQGMWPRDGVGVAASAAARPSLEARLASASTDDEVSRGAAATCRTDRVYEQIASALEGVYPSRFQAVRYECLDAAGHSLLRYARPGAFGDVSDEEVQRYGTTLGAYYAAADAAVGRAVAQLRPGDLLLVASGFGMQPMDVSKRLLERTFGNSEPSGTHEKAPDGFLLAYGTNINPGRYPRASIVDLAPTILYYFGLPVGRDMDGYARTDIFDRAFAAERPITFIPTYER